ncbi:hypothetical protein [Sorangium sp. So ce381]|uniref:hypothetical protein n=1 Tax=Sorangium sp. So ce381 TaxID=3133307 RepID=UPI003F5BEC62
MAGIGAVLAPLALDHSLFGLAGAPVSSGERPRADELPCAACGVRRAATRGMHDVLRATCHVDECT